MHMNLEERVLKAKECNNERNLLISDYKAYIFSCANKSIGRHISDSDDEMDIALIAFNEAIEKYDLQKGSFLNFAAIIIKSRIIDYMRKEYKHSNIVPLSSLSTINNDGEEIVYDIPSETDFADTLRLEIQALTEELAQYNITFLELSKVTPKAKKTKEMCFRIIKYITLNEVMENALIKSGTVPATELSKALNVHKKIIERHRKYIIAAIIILKGEYENIAEYFDGVRRCEI